MDTSREEPFLRSENAGRTAVNGTQPRTVTHCSFRSVWRGSDDVRRLLTDLHKTFARNLQGALELYLGAEIQVRFRELIQVPLSTYLRNMTVPSHISPIVLDSLPYPMVLEGTGNFSSLIIDLLLGGKTDIGAERSGLSEIEAELMLDATCVMSREVETAWGLPSMSMHPGGWREASGLSSCFRAGEALVVAVCEVELSGVLCLLNVIFPAAAAGMLTTRMGSNKVRIQPRITAMSLPIQDRILDCEVSIAAELTDVKVPVKDLMALRPGAILKLDVPVNIPGALVLGEPQIFEATIVRNQMRRAAKVGRRTLLP
jgi:flagellar motor switch protein FliM